MVRCWPTWLALLAGCDGSVTIADHQHCPIALAVDEQGVYWLNGDGTVMKADHAGGAPVQLAVSAEAVRIAVGGDSVFFATDGQVGTGSDSIFQVARSGGAATAVVTGSPGVRMLAARSSGIYWCDEDNNLQGAALDGSDRRWITAPVYSFAVDDQFAYWIDFVGGSAAMAKTPLAGGASLTLGQGDVGGDELLLATAVWGDDVYWQIDSSESGQLAHLAAMRIERAPLAGGATVILHGDRAWPSWNAFAVDGSGIYWADTPDDQLMRTSLDGSSTVRVVGTQGWIRGLAVDAANLYWIDSGDDCSSSGKVRRIAKPQ